MPFDKIYDECRYIVFSAMKKANIWGDPCDFVDEAYMQLIDEKSEITKASLSKKCLDVLRNKPSRPGQYSQEYLNALHKICSKCKKDLPADRFGKTENNYREQRTIQNYCKECQREYFKEYFNSMKDEWNAYLRERYKKDAENLTDTYIKKYLRCYGWKTKDITPEVIRHKRKELQSKKAELN